MNCEARVTRESGNRKSAIENRKFRLFFFALVLALPAFADTVHPLPTPFPEARYQQMSAKSPFAVATAITTATAAATPGFAAQLYVDGIAHIGNNDFVAIKSRDPDKTNVMFLGVGGTSDDGMKIDRVNWSDETAKSTVDVSMNGERATLSFDEANLHPAAQPNQPGIQPLRLPGQGRPVGFPQPPGVPRIFPQPGGQPPGAAGNSTILRHRRGAIPAGQ